jgi:hypothetical protein
MKIIALIIVVILVSPAFVAAVEPADHTGVPATSEFQEVRSYTGIIKNKTRYEVAIPSQNSDATVLIPPHGWIEYTIWTQKSDVTAYHGGQPFYCLKISAQPEGSPFMCKKYDFIAEIGKEEPALRRGSYGPSEPSKLKRRKIKRTVNNPPC